MTKTADPVNAAPAKSEQDSDTIPVPPENEPPFDWDALTNREQQERCSAFQSLVKMRGKRYAACRFENFEATTEAKKAARDAIIRFAEHLDQHIADGTNLVLFGPCGTGKDHLMFALMRYAVKLGCAMHSYWSKGHGKKTLQWGNGVDMYSGLRATFDDSHASERDWLAKYADPSVLAISDPLPPVGNLTDFQQGALLNILDMRYSQMKPTWVTVNVADGNELDERLGLQSADRLRHDAVVVHYNWESYRKART